MFHEHKFSFLQLRCTRARDLCFFGQHFSKHPLDSPNSSRSTHTCDLPDCTPNKVDVKLHYFKSLYVRWILERSVRIEYIRAKL